MSLNLPSIGAAATASPPASATARSTEAAPPGAGSFGEALSRATQADAPEAKTPRGKAAAGTPEQRPGGAPETETEEAVEPALMPELAMMMALESRSAPPTFHGGALAAATGEPRQEKSVADSLAPPLAGAALAADEAPGLPAAGTGASVPAASAAALALAAASPQQRGQVPAAAGLKTSLPGGTLAGAPDAAEAPMPLTSREMAAPDPFLPRSFENRPTGGFTGASQAQAGTALPPAAHDAARQALSAAPPAEEAVVPTPVDSPALIVPGAEAGAVPAPAMTAPAAQGPAGLGNSLPSLPVTAPSLPQDVGSSEWGQALGQQVLQMGKAGQEVAELQLHPPGLGPLKVTLSMNEHQLQAAFVSTHASVRAAVEAALPQLRAALADSGISLGNTSVGTDSRQPADADQGQGARPGQRTPSGASVGRDLAGANERPVVPLRSQGHGAGVDLYA